MSNNITGFCAIQAEEVVAIVHICGAIHFTITDNMPFIRPTPEQIQNLHDMFCIDVELKGDTDD